MKRVYISILMLAATAVCCYAALMRLEISVDDMTGYADKVAAFIQQEDFYAAKISVEKLEADWRRQEGFFHIIIGSRDCGDIEQSLQRIKIRVAQKEKSPEALSELSDLVLCFRKILLSQKPGIATLL